VVAVALMVLMVAPVVALVHTNLRVAQERQGRVITAETHHQEMAFRLLLVAVAAQAL
jgi:hypothetical protein